MLKAMLRSNRRLRHPSLRRSSPPLTAAVAAHAIVPMMSMPELISVARTVTKPAPIEAAKHHSGAAELFVWFGTAKMSNGPPHSGQRGSGKP